MENLKPLRQSNFSTACMRPRLPSWIRSSKRQAGGLVLLRDRNDEPQVGLDKCPLCRLPFSDHPVQLAAAGGGDGLGLRRPELLLGAPTSLDGLCEAYLVVLGEQRILADIGQIQPDEIFLVALNSLFRQGLKASVGSAGTAPRCPK